jgi:SAM-dependent methyltransferase/uncharacterized protein YbaR (Trm112 family)
MNTRLLSLLSDPNDGQELELRAFASEGERVREGVLLQPESGRWYPVHNGIPSIFIDALRVGDERVREAAFVSLHRSALEEAGCRLDSFDAQSSPSAGAPDDFSRMDSERRARDEQAEDYDRMLALKILERIETPAYRRALADALPEAARRTPLLEAGCGTGRFTALFCELAEEVVAVDLSRDSIERNRVRHASRTRATVHYVHADLTHLPLRDGVFGSVAHCGVYEHIPSRELRQKFLAHARRSLRPDGALLLSAYRYNGMTKLFGKEGEHDGGIPFFRFTEEELRGEVEPFFSIDQFRENLGIYMSMVVGTPQATPALI